jgi:hypothetical protein
MGMGMGMGMGLLFSLSEFSAAGRKGSCGKGELL